MRILGLLLCIVALQLFSCKNGVISKDEMVDILADVHMAKELARQVKRDKDTSIDYYTEQYLLNAVFEDHNISEEDFENSVVYYANRPDVYLEVYKSVADELKMRLSMLQPKTTEEDRQEISSKDTIVERNR
ncbi:MAG: DUF4296 domain-containing protein [Bacteroidales bacterium]